jgi:kynurenine 3-monooxygenase
MNAAEAQGAKIVFEQRCTGLDLNTGTVQLRGESTGATTKMEADVVIGCDGSASAIRSEMSKSIAFKLTQQYLDYGYKELTIPAGPGGIIAWKRVRYTSGARQLHVDRAAECPRHLCVHSVSAFEGGIVLRTDDSGRGQVLQLDFLTQLRRCLTWFQISCQPTGRMATTKRAPGVDGRALLLGDAAHAIVPFFGQGINCGFEECTCLLALLDRYVADWERVFAEFEAERKINTDAIADLAVENFVEMRDRVADPRFLFRKKVELALEAKYPRLFVPKYAMVTFHRIPYATALKRGVVQDRLLTELCDGVDRLDDLDWGKADQLVHSELTPLELTS